jgi:hypothetical protein
VDQVTVDELTGKIVLLIEEDRAWHEQELMHRQLSAKVKNYVRHIRSKEFAQQHGQRPQDTIVRLLNTEAPNDESLRFLVRVGYELSKHGIEFEHQLGNEGIPVALVPGAPDVTAVPVMPGAPAATPTPTAPPVEDPPTATTSQPTPAEPEELEAAQPAQPEPLEPVAEAVASEPSSSLEESPPTEVPDTDELFVEVLGFEAAERDIGDELAAFEIGEGDEQEPTPAFASPDDLGPSYEPAVPSFDPNEQKEPEEPSELELLIDSAESSEIDLVDEEEAEELVTAQARRGKKKGRPPFFPEEEFGRALPDVDEVEAILMGAEPAIIETSSGQRIRLDVADLTPEQAAAARADRPNLLRAVGAACVAALAGAIVWAALSVGAGHGASPLALAIALMVGISVRLRGNGSTMPFRFTGVLATLLGSLIGATLAAAALSAWQDATGFAGILDNLSSVTSVLAAFSRQYRPYDLIALLLALYLAFRLSASKPSS